MEEMAERRAGGRKAALTEGTADGIPADRMTGGRKSGGRKGRRTEGRGNGKASGREGRRIEGPMDRTVGGAYCLYFLTGCNNPSDSLPKKICNNLAGLVGPLSLGHSLIRFFDVGISLKFRIIP